MNAAMESRRPASMGRSMTRGTRTIHSPAPVTMAGMPAGAGAVGTATNPSPSMPGVTTGLKRTPPTPNSGGIIAGPGAQRRVIPPDAGYKGPLPTGFGTAQDSPNAWRGAQRPALAPNVDPGAEMGPGANRPAQSERANPLVNGGGPPQVEGTSAVVPKPTLNPGKAMGFNQRGNKAPVGDDLNQPGATDPNAPPADGENPDDNPDAAPGDGTPQGDLAATREGVQNDLQGGGHVGGIGKYARSFSNPTSASIYHDYTKRLFGNAATPKSNVNTGMTRTGPRDNGTESDGGEDY